MGILDLPGECLLKLALYLDPASVVEASTSCKSLHSKLTSEDELWTKNSYWTNQQKLRDEVINYELFRKYRNIDVELMTLGRACVNGVDYDLNRFMANVQRDLKVSEYIYLIKTIVACIATLNQSATPMFDTTRFPFFRGQPFEGLGADKIAKLKGLFQHVLTELKCLYSEYLFENPHIHPALFSNPDKHVNILNYIAVINDNFGGDDALTPLTVDSLTNKIWSRLYDKVLSGQLTSPASASPAKMLSSQMPAALADRQRLLASYDKLQIIDAVLTVMYAEGFAGNSERYYDPVNSFLDHVCLTKKGLPISLCALADSVAVNVGLDPTSVGLIAYPAHVVLAVKIGTSDSTDSFRYYDIFNRSTTPLTYYQLPDMHDSSQLQSICTRFMAWRCIGGRTINNLIQIFSMNTHNDTNNTSANNKDDLSKELLCHFLIYIQCFRPSKNWPIIHFWVPMPAERQMEFLMSVLTTAVEGGYYNITLYILYEYQIITGNIHFKYNEILERCLKNQTQSWNNGGL